MEKKLPSITLSENKTLLLLFVLAFCIRIIGIDFGYWLADERINDAAKVLAGKLVPGQHFYPPLLNYINAVFLALLYAIGRLVPSWHSVEDFRSQYFSDPTAFYLTCRAVAAMFSAATAPLFYLIAKSLQMSRRQCVIAGVFGILIPVMIYLAHLSKSDVHLASCAIFVFYSLIQNYRQPENLSCSLVLGFAIALAVSFKHSYIFILGPLMMGHVILMWRDYGLARMLRSLGISTTIMLPAWCVMNIGILMDFRNFLDFQKIQAEMSVREGHGFFDPFAVWVDFARHEVYGVGPLIMLLFLAFPFYLNSRLSGLKHRLLLNNFWFSIAFSSVIVAAMSGVRQHSGLWLPYFASMHLFACLMLIDALRSGMARFSPLLRTSAGILLSSCLVFSLYGTSVIFKQSLARPNAASLASYIRDNHGDEKILSSANIRLPKAKQAATNERLRHERLAEKYGVELPVRAKENAEIEDVRNPIYIRSMPQVMFGLEDTDEDSLEGFIKPYTWPPQAEDWQLDTWLEKGFTVIVVADFDYYRYQAPQDYFRNFYASIESRCQRVKHFVPVKPYFFEFPVTVFSCTGA